MKKYITIAVILLFFYSCDYAQFSGIDPAKILGSNGSPIPYGKYGHTGYLDIDGIRYTTLAAHYKNKIIAYVFGKDGYIFDYYFSKYIKYEKINRNLPGSSYDDIIKKYGKPAFEVYGSLYGELQATYLQYEKSLKSASPWVVTFVFDDDILLYFMENKLID
jgi:hypothetical protein